MQLLSCICNLASMCFEELRELACIIDRIADFVYMTTVGCMTVRHEKTVDGKVPGIFLGVVARGKEVRGTRERAA